MDKADIGTGDHQPGRDNLDDAYGFISGTSLTKEYKVLVLQWRIGFLSFFTTFVVALSSDLLVTTTPTGPVIHDGREHQTRPSDRHDQSPNFGHRQRNQLADLSFF